MAIGYNTLHSHDKNPKHQFDVRQFNNSHG